MAETPYIETETLLAVMNDDRERLDALVAELKPGEVKDLYRHTTALQNVLWGRMQDDMEAAYRPRHGRA
jgi:hypothetical protein